MTACNGKLEVTICMGSSCFARGNGGNLELLEAFISEHGLEAEITLAGSRCEGRCAEGPNMVINGVLHGAVRREHLLDVLREYAGQEREEMR